jgi:hypothetical protein
VKSIYLSQAALPAAVLKRKTQQGVQSRALHSFLDFTPHTQSTGDHNQTYVVYLSK